MFLTTWENTISGTVETYLSPELGPVSSKTCYHMQRCCWKAFWQVVVQDLVQFLTLKIIEKSSHF
jgi:hypothetical protein